MAGPVYTMLLADMGANIIKPSATPGQIRRRAPALGEHSQDILAENGFDEGELGKLLESRVILG